ncbi:hypothetical protein BH23GEM9_BH23GEM9_12810 [soil metagenome]
MHIMIRRPPRFPACWYALPLLALLVVQPASLSGQAPAAEQTQAGQPADAPLPPAFEVVNRHPLVMDSAAQVERDVARLAVVVGISAEFDDAVQRHADLRALLASLVETDFVRPERLSRVRDQALIEDQRLEALRNRTVERLEQLNQIRANWLERQRFWHTWQSALRPDPDFNVVAAELQATVGRIQTLLDQVAAANSELMTLQRRIEDLRGATNEIGSFVASIRDQRRDALLQRSEPVLLSPAHRAQLAEHGWRPRLPATHTRASAYLLFLRGNAGMIAFHIALVVLLALLARHLHAAARPDASWAGLLQHPWTLAVFASVALALQRVTLAPPVWDVLLWSLLAGTGAIIARHLFVLPSVRRAVYLFAAFYPVFLLLEIARFPTPLFRLVIAAVAAVAFAAFIRAARMRRAAVLDDDSLTDQARRVWPLRVGAALSLVVVTATVLGYDVLARWVTHAAVTSAAVLFVVALIVTVLRGAVTTLLRFQPGGQTRTLRRLGLPLAQRLMLLLQIVIIAAAAVVLLDVWELAPSPVVTWQRIISFGVTIGPIHLTVGRILVGVALIYLAVTVSWIVRTLVQTQFRSQWDLDRGVGESISTLVHYSLITIGFIFALGALGVELQNFAIIAGALGIGIGFGLQNVVNNFVSGLILLFERPVRIGDTVIVGGEWGTITKIGLRSTIMLTFDQSEMIVPNADLISEKVTNWTLSNPVARVILPVGVAYGSNIAQVLQILRDAGTAHESVLRQPPPQALFVGFGDSSLDFELRVWVAEIRLRLEVRSTVLADVERRLSEAAIEIPFPQRDLHLRSVDSSAAAAMLRAD